ncbi:hypothetical protein WJX81_000028 [Elliptochloris bilobata]|uniref:Phosphotransferase n=1 Tax=Elliptochloris bilobata TaxID=381761 RepID=A0AAW1QVG5_9CHLO
MSNNTYESDLPFDRLDSRRRRELAFKQYQERLHIPTEALQKLTDAFIEQLELGLREKQRSSLLMLPTMVDVLPQGQERGEYYSIDSGGKNIRLLYTRLGKDKHTVEEEKVEVSRVPVELHKVPVEELFDYIAKRMISWSETQGCAIAERQRPVLGFCCSFPVDHHALDAGSLIQWSKGFENPGGVGADPAKLLREAFQRQGVPRVHINALLNDTVATLAAARYLDGPDAIGSVIMGTGTNACYIEQLGNITKWMPRYRARTPDMVVNIEWPGFAAPELPVLEEDRALDAESNNPGQQQFEKMTAGLYTGDIARRLLLSLAEDGELFSGAVPERLRRMGAFTTTLMNLAAEDATPDLARVGAVLEEAFGLPAVQTKPDIRREVRQVCVLVRERSARLIAAMIAGILRHLHRDRPRTAGGELPRTVVAVDGGVFVRHADYRAEVLAGVRDILGDAVADRFSLKVVEAGSPFGAACVAAAADSYMRVAGGSLNFRPPVHKLPAVGQSR